MQREPKYHIVFYLKLIMHIVHDRARLYQPIYCLPICIFFFSNATFLWRPGDTKA